MANLLKSFGRTKTWVNNSGLILFESSIPGTYTRTMSRKTRCGIYCVGGGVGGFSAKTGITINEGMPGHEATFTGLMASSGASGGYSYTEHTFNAGDTLIISVGAGGTSYASTALYGTIAQSHPSLTLGNVAGGASRVIVGSSLILFANSGTAGRMYFTNPADPNTMAVDVSAGGSGSAYWGNNGTATGSGSNLSLAGGASVYAGYGAGGSAGFTGDNQSGSPWAANGSAGYVKIVILSSDNT